MISWDMLAPAYASIAIAITVKRSEEVVCSVTIQIDPRFAMLVRCSWGTQSRSVRAFSQGPLTREVIDYLSRSLATDEGREFFHCRD